ncbi:MAG: VOC family protein, partial [Chloroflexota bacterium]|nr:VOC family protein [Chloroflexota bacterium]
LADFYVTYLGMRELGRGPAGDVSLTDGFYNLSLLKRRAELGEDAERPGLSHYGIEIEDIREVEGQLEELAPSADIREENGDLHHGEYRVHDPNGLAVSLSTKGFGVSTNGRSLPCIRHIALSVPKGDEVLDFYTGVFGFREVTTSLKWRTAPNPCYFAGDGGTNLAILPEPDRMRDTDRRFGLNHFGFLVPDMEQLLSRLPAEAGAAKRPPRPMAEQRAHDPDGNPFDLSRDLGYEVDYDRWERVE